jgi:hypothetical protein
VPPSRVGARGHIPARELAYLIQESGVSAGSRRAARLRIAPPHENQTEKRRPDQCDCCRLGPRSWRENCSIVRNGAGIPGCDCWVPCMYDACRVRSRTAEELPGGRNTRTVRKHAVRTPDRVHESLHVHPVHGAGESLQARHTAPELPILPRAWRADQSEYRLQCHGVRSKRKRRVEIGS